jgi:hypothetical protein
MVVFAAGGAAPENHSAVQEASCHLDAQNVMTDSARQMLVVNPMGA